MESEPALPDPGSEAVPTIPSCPGCGEGVEASANFCPLCGAALQEGLAPPPRRLTSRQIEHDLNSSTAPVRRPLFFYLLWLATGGIFSLAAYAGAASIPVIMAIDTVTTSVTLGWAAGLRRDVFRLLAWPRGGLRWPALAVLAAWPIAAVISLFVGWINRFIGFEFSYTSLFFDAGYGWSWIVLLICIQPALIEELAFRGILLSSLGEVMKPAEAVVVSAIAFAIMHFNLAMFVPFTLLAIYFGWMRLRSGSLWPGILAHFIHNLLVTLDEIRPILPG
jgi:membrane protease YdiL (CAAX protease family)